MFCLEHTHVPLVKLPTGFTIVSVNTLVQGVCKNCA
jgi:Fe2+ or Zn2+ uptake regulation protein